MSAHEETLTCRPASTTRTLGPDHFPQPQPRQGTQSGRLIHQLNQLGYSVTLNPISPAA